MTKHVIFGYEGVVANVDRNIFINKMVQYSPHNAATLRRIIFRENKHLLDSHTTGWLKSGDFYNAVKNAAEFRHGEICPSIFKNAYTNVYSVREDTVLLIDHLRANGVMIGLVVNASPTEYEYSIYGQDVCKKFAYIVKSSDPEVKLLKPSPRIYEYMMQQLQVDPADCIYVDRLKKNINGAKKAKLPGVLFESAEDVAHKLVELGVIDSIPPEFVPIEQIPLPQKIEVVEVPIEPTRGLSRRRFD